MTLTFKHYLIIAVAILTVAVGISTYKLIEVSQRAKSLEASHKILEKDFLDRQETIEVQFDSLAGQIEILNQYNSDLLQEIDLLNKTKADRKTKKDEKDTDISRINDTNGIYSEVARHYRH